MTDRTANRSWWLIPAFLAGSVALYHAWLTMLLLLAAHTSAGRFIEEWFGWTALPAVWAARHLPGYQALALWWLGVIGAD